MNIFGYSERGAINALMFEIAFSPHSTSLLQRLLERAMFLRRDPPAGEINAATVLIEQSLSDFGDADAILLLDRPTSKSAVFVEGKVKSSQTKDWTLAAQFAAFQDGLTAKVSSSNLFAQLYHKVRFAIATQGEGQQMLRNGVQFPACSSKSLRRIGTNPVVLRAVQRITPYAADPYYLAIVPDSNFEPATLLHALQVSNNSRPPKLLGGTSSAVSSRLSRALASNAFAGRHRGQT
jgi:hypothetical protein